ncbi:MAG: hypothetical protein HY735_06740 [Verrucomicrobia bacterium]|nr:hypothetical protein [Verrucomicrobiota bacterium]
MDLSGVKAELAGRWFNPHDGTSDEWFMAADGGPAKFKPPDAADWVPELRVRAKS